KRALYEYHIEGVKVTIPFCLAVLNQSEFVKGTFSTKFVELYWDKLQQEQEAADVIDVIAAAIAYHRDMKKQHQITPTEKNGSLNQISPWKIRALNEMTRMK
ncbi:MAG: hypothetical protein GWN16_11860, partial [Calditrichae bacterium]|nr:hypothetical protein [Calditrichia bacterium]